MNNARFGVLDRSPTLNYEDRAQALKISRSPSDLVLRSVIGAIAATLFGGGVWLLNEYHKGPHRASIQTLCAHNLKYVGLACYEYANGRDGNFPDSLEELVRVGGTDVNYLICPSTYDRPAPGNTAAEQASHLSHGHHTSFIYVGKGLNQSVPYPEDVVLAYEPYPNHGGGGNFLFADGHVQWEPWPSAQSLIAAIPAARQPAP